MSDLFSSVLARIQVLMLTRDIEAMSDPTFIPDSSNTVYIIFLIIGIFGYFTIPTVANWIIMAGGVSQANRAMNQTANRSATSPQRVRAPPWGTSPEKSSSSGGCPKKMSHNE